MKKIRKAFQSLKTIVNLYEQIFVSTNERTLLKEIQKQDDLFLTMVLSEQLGVENPIIWHMLELYPFLLDQMHDWHKRMGMDKCPFEGLKCC